MVVLDAPTAVNGLALGVPGLEIRLGADAAREPVWLTAQALPLYTRTREFAERRQGGLALLSNTDRSRGADREVLLVRATEGTGEPPWRAESRSRFLLLDPATVRFVRVEALPDTSTAEPPRIAWRALEPAGEWSVATGVWVRGEGAPVALFDPWRDRAWWTASTIRRMRGEDPLLEVALFDLLADLPLVLAGGGPRADGDDWVFEIADASLATPLRGEAVFVLEFLARSVGSPCEYVRIDCRASSANGRVTVRAPLAARIDARMRGARALAVWSLDRRVGEVTIARAGGDLAP